MKIAAGILIKMNDSFFLVHPTGSKWWKSYSIPKGGIDEGESIIDCAIRETMEETGVSIKKSQINNQQPKTFNVGKKKLVYYYTLEINSLSEIGLTSPKIKKSDLQLDEVDWAGFVPVKEVLNRITKSQYNIIKQEINESILLDDFDKFEKNNKKWNY